MAKTKTVVKNKDGTTTELSNLSSAEIKELVKLVKKKRKVVGDDASISSDSVDDLPLINKKQKTSSSSSSSKAVSASKSKKVESTSKISSAEKKSKTSGVVSKKTTVSVKDAKKTSTSNPTIQNKTCRESAKKSSTLSKKKEKSGNVAMGNKHNGDSPMGSKQSSKSQSKKATISLLDDSDDEKKKPERVMTRYSPGRPAPGSEGKPEISIETVLPAWMADVKAWLPADQLPSQWSQDIKKNLRWFAIDKFCRTCWPCCLVAAV